MQLLDAVTRLYSGGLPDANAAGEPVNMKSLSELQTPDERTLRFTPYGLGIDRALTPEAAAEYQQAIMAAHKLAPVVSDGTRRSFDMLRDLYVRGIFHYETFTAVHDRALLVIEQALRDRFVAFHNGSVTFVDRDDARHVVTVDQYEQVVEAIRRNRYQRLSIGTGRRPLPFDGHLHDLREWARHVALLRGQWNRSIEQALCRLRNTAAHPNGFYLLTPVEAGRTIADVAEFINQLWGHPTPGGRLYPAPVERVVAVLSWAGEQFAVTPAQVFLHQKWDAGPGWRHAVIRCVPDDPDLMFFDSRYESTRFPSEVVHGPANMSQTRAWLRKHSPAEDTCDVLDRTFFVRVTGDSVYRPISEETARVLPPADHAGHWYKIVADIPGDALSHVRHLQATTVRIRTGRPCTRCPATTLCHGTYARIIGTITSTRSAPAVVRAPLALPQTLPVLS
ncbi:hypothetical protein ACQEVF_56485 [Nonomuraea polychroma]|uniref:hypothetical protein n=1 Tax=Nonomuraea polychroma TaxID=46176 RepID=UPI003D909E16